MKPHPPRWPVLWQRPLIRVALLLSLAGLPLMGGCEMSPNGEFRLNGIDTAASHFPDSGLRALARAAAAGRADEVRQLIQRGTDPNGQGKDTMTPLMWAVFARNAAGVQALLEGGAKAQMPITVTRSSGASFRVYPVEMAARYCLPQIMESLLQHGADPETKDGGANTVLVEASHCFACFKLLVDHGADVNREIDGVAGNTATAHGSANRHYDTVLYALQHGYRIELDRLNYRIETGEVADHLLPLRAEILALLKTKGVKPWVPPYMIKRQEAAAAREAEARSRGPRKPQQ